jgi:hypothetical protein
MCIIINDLLKQSRVIILTLMRYNRTRFILSIRHLVFAYLERTILLEISVNQMTFFGIQIIGYIKEMTRHFIELLQLRQGDYYRRSACTSPLQY